MRLDVTEKKNSCLNRHTVDQADFVILSQNKKDAQTSVSEEIHLLKL